MFKKGGRACCEWGDKIVAAMAHCYSTAGQRDQLFPFVSQLLVLVVLPPGLLACVVYGWQAWSKGNQYEWGWWWLGGKLFFGCVANQSDLIKVTQPVLPTTFLAFFSLLFMWVPSSLIRRTERKMDERRWGWRGVDMEESTRTGRLRCLCKQSQSEEAEERGRREKGSGQRKWGV